MLLYLKSEHDNKDQKIAARTWHLYTIFQLLSSFPAVMLVLPLISVAYHLMIANHVTAAVGCAQAPGGTKSVWDNERISRLCTMARYKFIDWLKPGEAGVFRPNGRDPGAENRGGVIEDGQQSLAHHLWRSAVSSPIAGAAEPECFLFAIFKCSGWPLQALWYC